MKKNSMIVAGIIGMLFVFGFAAADAGVPISLTDPYFGDESTLQAGPEPTWFNLQWKPPVEDIPQTALTEISGYIPSSKLVGMKAGTPTPSGRTVNLEFHEIKKVTSLKFR